MAPGYLKTLRQAIRKPGDYEINEKNEIRGVEAGLNSFNSFNSWPATPDLNSLKQKCSNSHPLYQAEFDALERRCPNLVPDDRWKEAIESARQFLTAWGWQAHALGWTPRELFGLLPFPANPHPSLQRLSRYDATGLIWLLRGRRVIALTETEAAIQSAGAIVVYRKNNKPALGPFGDSLDDMGAAT